LFLTTKLGYSLTTFHDENEWVFAYRHFFYRYSEVFLTKRIRKMKKISLLLVFIAYTIISNAQNTLTNMEKMDGYQLLFNGENLDGWVGNKVDYVVENGMIVIYPGKGGSGNLFTEKEYGDFIFRFEFQLSPGANNGLGIRAPLEGDAAYQGMELQIIDDTNGEYKGTKLKEYQYHGSVYGVVPAKHGFLKPAGEWNSQEVIAKGDQIKVVLNGEVIVDADIKKASKGGTIDGKKHPGLKNKKGHIGFLGHGDVVKFRSIRVKEL